MSHPMRLRHAWLSAGLALAPASPIARAQPKTNQGLPVNERGMTLYTFDNDATIPGKSACTGACLNMWTPFYAKAGAKAQGELRG
ncbi:MAG: hypothetical protein KIT28_07820 [Rubrivivax sp.]|nr:hypothetical protein [Rubrivivax sp.]HRY89206.1 hypothetical protein [Rubrivivax sp.]